MKERREPNEDFNQKIKIRIREEERNLFKDEAVRRYRMERRTRTVITLSIVLGLIFLGAVLLPAIPVSRGITPAEYVQIFTRKIADLGRFAAGGTAKNAIDFSIYRLLIVGCVGAALALSGAVYQGSFKNALASPSTLGVQSGGSLGGCLYVFFFMSAAGTEAISYEEYAEMVDSMSVLQRYGKNFAILAGCFLGVVLIVSISKAAGKGKVSTLALILSGSVFSSIIGGAVSLIQYYMILVNPYDPRTETLRYMMMGTFDNAFTLETMLMVCLPILIGIAVIMSLRTKLNLLVFGEDEARSLGIQVDRIRNTMVAVVTILTAITISYCGQIGFVGFIVPHMARFLVGPDFRYLIPASCLLGAASMLVVYQSALILECSTNINLMTSLVGGVLFLCILVKYRRNSNADWA